MVDFETFEQITQLRKRGYSWTKITQELGISYMTAKKYYNMSPEDFEKRYEKAYLGPRRKRGDSYKEELIDLIRENREMSSAQLYRMLKEKYGDELRLKESTLRRYVRFLREETDMPNPKNVHVPKKYLKNNDDHEDHDNT